MTLPNEFLKVQSSLSILVNLQMSIQLGHMSYNWLGNFFALLYFKIEYFFKDARPEREDSGSAHLQYKHLDGLIRTFMS